MTAGIARTGPRPRMWAISGWAGTARPITGWSPSPRCGLMSGCITRCTRCRTPRRGTSRRARAIRGSGPSWRSARTWRSGPGMRGSCSGRWPPTARTGTRTGSAPNWPRRGTWAYGPDAHTPVDAARVLAWDGPDDPGDWQPVTRTFRDGHTETWWAADATLGWWGPDGLTRLVVATADPGTLPGKATWYLATNLPRPGGPREAGSVHPAADLAEITR